MVHTPKLLNSTTEDCRIKEYEQKIKKVNKDIDGVFNQFRIAKSKVLIDKLNQEADELNELKLLYEKELKKIKKLALVKLSKNEISSYLESFIALGNSEDFDEKEKFINTFINAIYLYNNKTYIYLNNEDEQIKSTIGYETFKEDENLIVELKNEENYYYDNNSKNGSDIKPLGLPSEQ